MQPKRMSPFTVNAVVSMGTSMNDPCWDDERRRRELREYLGISNKENFSRVCGPENTKSYYVHKIPVKDVNRCILLSLVTLHVDSYQSLKYPGFAATG